MHIRHPDPKQFVTPAPGSYSPEKADKNIDTSPKYSFGLRTNHEVKSVTPGMPLHQPFKKSFFTHFTYVFFFLIFDLGPNVYKVPPVLGNCPEGTKKKAPAYTISGRGKDLLDVHAAIPGPGKYESPSMNMFRKKAPSYSLSVRTQLPSDDTKKPGPGAHSPEKVSLSYAPD